MFFGGGGLGIGKSQTLNMFEILVKSFTNIQIIAISGNNKKLQERFNSINQKYSHPSTIILGFSNHIPELMSISDIVITKPRWSYINRSFSL